MLFLILYILLDLYDDIFTDSEYASLTTDDAIQYINTRITALAKEDRTMQEGLLKMQRRMKNMSNARLISAIHQFGNEGSSRKRGKIQVQPGAVTRRSSKNGSRQKQPTRIRKLKSLPSRRITTLRPHTLSQLVEENIPIAKKSGKHKMISNKMHKKKTVKSEKQP